MVGWNNKTMRVLNTNSLDGLRAIAVLHIVLSHHSAYTGYIERSAPPHLKPDADEADAFGCSPEMVHLTRRCGLDRLLGRLGLRGMHLRPRRGSHDGRVWTDAGYTACAFRGRSDGAFYEYECCLPPTNYTDLMGIVRTAGTNYTDLVGVACGSFIPPARSRRTTRCTAPRRASTSSAARRWGCFTSSAASC